MIPNDSDKTKTLLGYTSSLGSQSEIQDYVFNIESFTNYSFTKPFDHRPSPLFKSFKNSLYIISALTLIALFTVLTACFIDLVAFNLIKVKKILINEISDPYVSCLAWISISLLFITCATSFGYFFAPEADGSGVPEVKAIISGVEMQKHLSFKTLICKVLGLVCCSGALSVGKEGPHVHIAAIIAQQVLYLKPFQPLRSHPGLQTLIMEASIAAGVSAVMAAPIGSVFFSMELTSTYYMITNIVFALYCGLLSSLLLTFYRLLNLTEVVKQTDIPVGFNNVDLGVFFVIGIVAGVVGVCFTMATKFFVECRVVKTVPWLHRRFRYAWTVTLFYSACCFFLPFMMLNAKQVLNQLLVTGDLDRAWEYYGVVGSLLAFASLKMLFTSLSTSVQIPGGVFLPVLISGAAFGRVMFELSAYLGGTASVAMFAAVSGCAFVASATHSLSVSLIIFEMTGQVHYVVPMLITVIISYSIGSSIGLNIYDAIILLKKLPYLPALRKTKLYRMNAEEIMEASFSVPFNCTNKQLRDVIFIKNVSKVAVVDENNYILADFNLAGGKKYLHSALADFKEVFSKDQYEKLKKNLECEEFDDEEYERIRGEEFKQFDSRNFSYHFWDLPVDFAAKSLKLNSSPISVEAQTSLYKIHYLFLMLGLMQLYITKDFKLSGVIYRHYFTSPNKK